MKRSATHPCANLGFFDQSFQADSLSQPKSGVKVTHATSEPWSRACSPDQPRAHRLSRRPTISRNPLLSSTPSPLFWTFLLSPSVAAVLYPAQQSQWPPESLLLEAAVSCSLDPLRIRGWITCHRRMFRADMLPQCPGSVLRTPSTWLVETSSSSTSKVSALSRLCRKGLQGPKRVLLTIGRSL